MLLKMAVNTKMPRKYSMSWHWQVFIRA